MAKTKKLARAEPTIDQEIVEAAVSDYRTAEKIAEDLFGREAAEEEAVVLGICDRIPPLEEEYEEDLGEAINGLHTARKAAETICEAPPEPSFVFEIYDRYCAEDEEDDE